MLILEKAWAKIYGSYQRIEAGTTGEALHPLTGSPCQTKLHKKITTKDLWDLIISSDEKNYVMCTAVASASNINQDSADMKAVGLVDAHAYSLISAKTV